MLTEMRLQIDDSILLSLKESKTTFIKEMLFQHAIQSYRKHKLSLGKAAELAGYTRLEFIRKLQAENEPIFDYDEALKPPRILFKSNMYKSCIQCHRNGRKISKRGGDHHEMSCVWIYNEIYDHRSALQIN
jgi:predicted HTH domain antitoxin